MEDFMSDPADCVLSKKAIESSTPEALVRDLNGAGTGPYKFVEWIAGDRIVFERNENYWGEKPEFKNLVFRIITDSTARTLAFEAGDVDICMQPPDHFCGLSAPESQLRYLDLRYFHHCHIVFNCTVAPLDNKQVRQALAYALDLDTIVDTVYSEPAESMTASSLPRMKATTLLILKRIKPCWSITRRKPKSCWLRQVTLMALPSSSGLTKPKPY